MANIKLNDSTWCSLSAEEQAQIIKILKDTTLLKQEDSIVPDASENAASQEIFDEFICRVGCDALATAAAAACAAGTKGAALAACLLAAEAARQACQNQC